MSAVVMGRTRSGSRPAAATMSAANRYQVVAPWLVTWKTPGRRLTTRSRTAPARSSAKVGQPCWSSTTDSCWPADARVSTVLTKLRPWRPHTHEVRTTVSPGPRADSPASFDRP